MVIPRLAGVVRGIGRAVVPAIACLVAAVVTVIDVIDPPRPPRSSAPATDLANPYRGSSVLARIHAVSVLLVAPQCLVWTFSPIVADDSARLVGRCGGRDGDGGPIVRCRGRSAPAGGRI